MFRFLIPPAVFLLLKNFSITSSDDSGYFSLLIAEDASQKDALIASIVFILSTAVAAAIVDMQVVFKMFCSSYHIGNDMVSSKKDLFVLVNWICSIAVLFNLPHLFSSQQQVPPMLGEECTTHEVFGNASDNLCLESKEINSFGSLVGFTSVSYLVGYFGILLAMKEENQRGKSRPELGAWKQYVPPLFFMGITAFLSKQSIYSVNMPVLAAPLFAFYVLNLLWVKKAGGISQISDSDSGHEGGSPAPQCDSPAAATGLDYYTVYSSPPGCEARQWTRQLGYDLCCYVLPLTAVPLAVPSLQLPCSVLCVFGLTLGRPIYEAVAKAIFLQDSPKENADDSLKRQKTYPKGSEFPTGWFRVMNSDQLPKLGVKYVQAMGRDLAVFRGEDGIARCLDAYCIHLGSNMAIGGKVKNNCLQCPFHLWSFDGSGKCTEIPYSPKVPAQAKTKAYHVAEWYGVLSVWFSSAGDEEKSGRPDYYPPCLEGIDDGSMVLRGKTELKVNMHLQEFAENSTDFAHFGPLHGVMGFPFTGIDLPMNMVTINHIPDWKEGTGDEAHLAWFLNKADLNIFGRHSPESGATAVITFVGPGGLVYFTFETPIGRLVLMQTNTPLEAMRMEVAFRWFADATMPRNLVWYIVGNWIAQYQNDIFIWENKKFLKSPFLVKGDGPMNKQRRWFKQFYPAQPAAEKDMEW